MKVSRDANRKLRDVAAVVERTGGLLPQHPAHNAPAHRSELE